MSATEDSSLASQPSQGGSPFATYGWSAESEQPGSIHELLEATPPLLSADRSTGRRDSTTRARDPIHEAADHQLLIDISRDPDVPVSAGPDLPKLSHPVLTVETPRRDIREKEETRS